ENSIFPAIDNMRIPINYLAELLTAGDTEHIRLTLKKMAAMREHMRKKQTGKVFDSNILNELGLTEEQIEEMYRYLAIAKYKDRFVIPESEKETVRELYEAQGACGLDFQDGPGSCGIQAEAKGAVK